MSNPNPTPPKPEQSKTISVKTLVFFQPHPTFDARRSVSAEPAINKTRVSIEFVPALRHHRVEVTTSDGRPRTHMIHEAHIASWEPLI